MLKMINRAFVCGALAMLAGTASAATYPDKPIKLVIPYAPGGPTDVLGRIVAERLGRVLKQPIVIENKSGAAGLIAMDQVAKATPDGYTLLLGDLNLAVSPALNASLRFDPVKDFAPIGMIATSPMLMLVPSVSPITSAQEFVAFAKENPGKVSYGSAGVGSPTHLAAEVLKGRLGSDMVHVPYQGSGPALNSLAAGDTSLLFTSLSSAKPLVDAGRIRPLAITGNQRSPVMPDVPTLEEAGVLLPELAVGSWWGLLAPAGVSADVSSTLSQALNTALSDPDIATKLAGLNYTKAPSGTDFGKWVVSEADTWTAVIKKAGIRSE